MIRVHNFSEFQSYSQRSQIFETKEDDIKAEYDSSYSFISDIYVTILSNSILSLIQKLTDESRSSLDKDGIKKLEDSVQNMIDAYDKCINSPLDSKFSELKNTFLNSQLPQAIPSRNPKIKYLSGAVISEYKKIIDYFPRLIDSYDQSQQDVIQFGINKDIDSFLETLTKTNESILAGQPILEKKSYQKDKYYGLIEDLSKRYFSLLSALEKEIKERSGSVEQRSKVLVSELKEIESSVKSYGNDLDLSQIGAHWDLSGKKITEKINKISDFLDSALNEMTGLLLGEIDLTTILQSLISKIEASFGRIDSLLDQISKETEEVSAAEVSMPSLDVSRDYPAMDKKFTSEEMPDGSTFKWDASTKKWAWTSSSEYTSSRDFTEQRIEFTQPLYDVKKQKFTYDFSTGKWHKGSIKGGEIVKENELAFLNKALEVLIKRSQFRWGTDKSETSSTSYVKAMKGDSTKDTAFDNLLKSEPEISNKKK